MADGFSHGVLLDSGNRPIMHFHQDQDSDCRYCATGVPYVPRPVCVADPVVKCVAKKDQK